MTTDLNYTKTIEVEAKPNDIFIALTEKLHLWWGNTSNVNFSSGGKFTVTFENGYWWTFKIIEYIPNFKLTWECIAGEPEFNKEWIGNTLYWLIDELDTTTKIKFLHVGLTPNVECYDVCTSTWDRFIVENLKHFVEIN